MYRCETTPSIVQYDAEAQTYKITLHDSSVTVRPAHVIVGILLSEAYAYDQRVNDLMAVAREIEQAAERVKRDRWPLNGFSSLAAKYDRILSELLTREGHVRTLMAIARNMEVMA